MIAPFFGLVGLPSGVNQWVTNLTTRLPNIPLPGTSPVPYQYLGMSTLSIGKSMRFARQPYNASERERPHAGSIVLVTIENDGVISNPMAYRVLEQWQANGSETEAFMFDAKFDLPHDVIDIHQEKANTDLVYPVLIDLVEGREPMLP